MAWKGPWVCTKASSTASDAASQFGSVVGTFFPPGGSRIHRPPDGASANTHEKPGALCLRSARAGEKLAALPPPPCRHNILGSDAPGGSDGADGEGGGGGGALLLLLQLPHVSPVPAFRQQPGWLGSSYQPCFCPEAICVATHANKGSHQRRPCGWLRCLRRRTPAAILSAQSKNSPGGLVK